MNTVSIVIPNYNGEQLIKKNFPKVLSIVKRHTEIQEIIFVDDASTDASALVISNLNSQFSILKLLQNKKNHGFASTVNRGVKESSSEIVLLLNTDAYPEEGFLEPALNHFKDEKMFAVGGMDKSIEREKTVLRGRGIGTWTRGFLIHSRGEVDKTNTLWVSGGSSFIRKSVWEKLGGLNEIYNPFYWEDIDISYRALKSGYKTVFEKNSVFVHEHSKGAIASNYSKSQVKQTAYRNQFLFVWLNSTDPSIILSHILWLPYHFVTAFLRLDFEFFIGFLKAFLLLLKVIPMRFRNQHLFINTDKDVMKDFNI